MPTENLYNEALLLEGLKKGNEEAFATLYRHYSPRLYCNILRMVKDAPAAEEMVQELFTRVWQKRDAAALQEHFEGYLYRIALNLVHDFFRNVKKDRALYERFRGLAETGYSHVAEDLQSRQSSDTLKKAIDQLPPQQKRVYRLVREEGFTYKKAAEVMNISPFTVKEYLSCTTKAIRQYLLRHANGIVLAFLFLFRD